MIKHHYFNHGNRLAYTDYGNPAGNPILIQHGLIASIEDIHLFDQLIEAGLRLICIARPGYGESSPHILENIAAWGQLIAGLVDELAITQFDILGMSSGAPYSYSIGYRLPQRTRNIFIFSGIPALYDPAVRAHWPYDINLNAEIPALKELAHRLFFTNLSSTDKSNKAIRDSMRNHAFGLALDFKIRCQPWGFNLSEVIAPVYLQHSRTDEQVPFVTADLTAKMLPRCHFHIRERGVHFTPEILEDFFQSILLPGVTT